MRRHIPINHATTKYFSNSFVFNTKIEKEGTSRRWPGWLGRRSPPVQIRAPRPKHFAYFLVLIKISLHRHMLFSTNHPRLFRLAAVLSAVIVIGDFFGRGWAAKIFESRSR